MKILYDMPENYRKYSLIIYLQRKLLRELTNGTGDKVFKE